MATTQPPAESSMEQSKVPDTLLVTNPTCPHCAAALGALRQLETDGIIANLRVIDADADPDTARRLGVRSVPWIRIGFFELVGAHSLSELKHWALSAGTPRGRADYLGELLSNGKRGTVLTMVRRTPELLHGLLDLLKDPDTSMHVRLGIDSLFEEIQGSPALSDIVEELGALSDAAQPRIRADACHYLALTGNRKAIPFLEARLQDGDRQVREIAREALTSLTNHEH